MDLDERLRMLADEPDAAVDVAEIALYLARDEFPDLDVEASLSELTAMGLEARSYVRGNLSARVQGLCRYLFHELGFRGNQREYYDPLNSYLNMVLERRTGIPISLSAIVMTVGRRAGLDIAGVGLPGHFVIKAYQDGTEIFVDPFHGGRVIAPEECEILVQQATGQSFRATVGTLHACPPALILQRMLNNLKGIYLSGGDFPRALRILERLRQLAPDDPSLRRDLGVGYLQTGQPGKSIDHFQAYLAANPHAADADTVKQVLQQARDAIVGWN